MALQTPCQTPGARYHTEITPERARVSAEVPLALTGTEAELLTANIHNVLELVLAPYARAAEGDPS